AARPRSARQASARARLPPEAPARNRGGGRRFSPRGGRGDRRLPPPPWRGASEIDRHVHAAERTLWTPTEARPMFAWAEVRNGDHPVFGNRLAAPSRLACTHRRVCRHDDTTARASPRPERTRTAPRLP